MSSVALQCGICSKHVAAEIVGALFFALDDYTYTTHLLKCPACGDANVTRTVSEFFGEWEEIEPPTRVYPAPDRELSSNTPIHIRKAFSEAQLCKSVGAFTGSAILSRRVVEGIAEDRNATGRNLKAKLTSMKNSGEIDGRLADWADALRLVGNDAAHRLDKQTSFADASDALVFAEALADYVYTYRARYDEFVRRQPAPPNQTATQPIAP
jgi:Domain of unknown function (DUF4145)